MSHAHDLPDGLVIRNLADFDARSGTLPERILFNNRHFDTWSSLAIL